jgi:hypothetical protein
MGFTVAVAVAVAAVANSVAVAFAVIVAAKHQLIHETFPSVAVAVVFPKRH